jgi:hypothetical protein
MVGETVEDACENALFASAEKLATAISYVGAQLSLLAYARDWAENGIATAALDNVRRAVEADRFGIVAHVLATREGCIPDRCAAFFLLHDPSQVRTNLVEHTFDARVKTHLASWAPSGSNQPGTASLAPGGAKPPSNVDFPSAASIPPVNIMTAEPAATPPPRNPPAAEASPARKPAPAPAPARPSSGSNKTSTRSAPMPLAPNAAD